jgi:peroxiredoxin
MISVRDMRNRLGLGAFIAAVALAGVTPVLVEARAQQQTAAMTMKTATPKEGEKAPDFSLTALDGTTVRLSSELAHGPVVLVVLRGWPGYQCPFCTRQFGEYIARAAEIDGSGAHVLFVYPGPAEGLRAHAREFTNAAPLPASYRVLLDPDYTFTKAYDLRWEAKGETAYPSTFILDMRGNIAFARTSHEHGDRVPVDDVMKVLVKLPR